MYEEFKPTWLMIKRHEVTGLKYLCKTNKSTKEEMLAYKGSGTRWTNHINSHGREHVVTDWYCLYTDRDECVNVASELSHKYNVVESDEWANLIEETGLHGGSKGLKRIITDDLRLKLSEAAKNRSRQHRHNEQTKKLISEKRKGISFSEKHKQSLSKAAKARTHKYEHTEKSKQKISDSKKNAVFSKEHREKLSIAAKARAQRNRKNTI